MKKNTVYRKISEFIESLQIEEISAERKEVLQPLIDFLQSKHAKNHTIRLNFICTHNSRRSHLSQVWAQTMAHYFQIKPVFCYSGGTAETAVYPMVIETLIETGFTVEKLSEGDNPIYQIVYNFSAHPIIGFSKRFDHDFNPSKRFAAIMTCSQADEGCPFVPGAEQRIAITYEDPKAFDDSPLQKEKYAERSRQIATEMYYVFSQLKS